MTKPKYAVDYDKCTAAELVKFAENRGLLRPLATVLRNADKNATFRFMDLFPELRNAVYRELLTLHSEGGKWFCYPEILVASRQINQEATSLLYLENTVRLDILRDPGFLVINGEEIEGPWSGCIRVPYTGWPSYLQRCRLFEVQVTVDRSPSSRTAVEWETKTFLYSLSSFLAQGEGIERLVVKWHWDHGASLASAAVRDTLWSICRLCPRAAITITGLDGETCKMIQDAMPVTKPPRMPFDVLGRYYQTINEALNLKLRFKAFPNLRDIKSNLDKVWDAAVDVGWGSKRMTPVRHEQLISATVALRNVIEEARLEESSHGRAKAQK